MRSGALRSPVIVASTQERLRHALAWLVSHPSPTELLVLGATLEAAHELLLRGVRRTGAAFGWRRATLGLLAHELAARALLEEGRAPVQGVAGEAVAARVVGDARAAGRLGRLAAVADTPGFVRALHGSLGEARLAGLRPERLAEEAPEVGTLLEGLERRLTAEGLADGAHVLRKAAAFASEPGGRHPLLGIPTLLLDVPLRSRLEAELAAALLGRSPDALVTAPAGDEATLERLREALGEKAWRAAREPAMAAESAEAPSSALARLQAHLFEREGPAPSEPDGTVTLLSAPGEGRECVEVARTVLELAEEGVPFDRMAVLLRSPEEYRPHLEEAFARARIPAHFARGVRRPDPAGRAFLALLRCRAEDYSAARFAEYLSLGEVPAATEEGKPPPPPAPGDRWVPSYAEAEEGGRGAGETAFSERGAAPDTLRVPRRWEKLLVEASVVGGRERWARRLAGLREQLEVRVEGLEDADDPMAGHLRRRMEDLTRLEAYALPLLEDLSRLPAEARWSEWLEPLSALAARALRWPERVLSVLSELAPLGPVGPVELAEVIRVLRPRLLEVAVPPEGPRYGKVYVAPVEAARGLAFDVVFVPGLAERLFPRKISEDPILLDEVRERLAGGDADGADAGGYTGAGGAGTGAGAGAAGAGAKADRAATRPEATATARPLPTNADRVAAERLALRLAAGAARERLVLSFPRLEAARARPRVPSFYALEAVRAGEGSLPRFDDLAKRAEEVTEARIGWPAPERPEEAIDEAEYDLAMLERLGLRGVEAVRAQGHLLAANPHLARALRFRAYRWTVKGLTRADGLYNPSEAARAALARHGVDARPFSATALQHFAACPYRFFLHAVQRLEPREEAEAIETLDPLEKGSLVHEVQFRLLSALRAEGLLPVRPETLERATERLDETVGEVAAAYRDRLVPAIERVWEDEIDGIRADLREWLHRESGGDGSWVPWRFELAFGLPPDPEGGRDPDSRPDPVELETGLRLRGSIDLVERAPDGSLRATDHKTGRARVKRGAVVQGGEALQPVLYALAAERLFPGRTVRAGRLYYCTSSGEFETREVPLDAAAREAAARVTGALRWALEEGCLPAAPAREACRWCDYLAVCGPDEERRTLAKPELPPLVQLRGLR